MSIVYLLNGRLGYEARVKERIEDYQFDRQLAERQGDQFVRGFNVPDIVGMEAWRLAVNFSNDHNSGKNPRLEDLVTKINGLTARKI